MSRERMPDGSTVERDEHGEIVAVYIDNDVWAAWEAERRLAVKKDRAGRGARLEDLAAKLATAGLRPVIDQELGLVRADCPDCHASAEDGGWRSLAVVPRAGMTLTCCDACGVEEVERV